MRGRRTPSVPCLPAPGASCGSTPVKNIMFVREQAYLGIWDLRPRGRIVERQTKVDFRNIEKYQTIQI